MTRCLTMLNSYPLADPLSDLKELDWRHTAWNASCITSSHSFWSPSTRYAMAIAVRCGGRKAPLVPQDDLDNTDRAGNHGRSRAVGIGSRNIIGCDLAVAHRVRNRVDSGRRNRYGRGVSRHRPRVGLRASRAGANI